MSTARAALRVVRDRPERRTIRICGDWVHADDLADMFVRVADVMRRNGEPEAGIAFDVAARSVRQIVKDTAL